MARHVAVVICAGFLMFAGQSVKAQPEDGQYYRIKCVHSGLVVGFNTSKKEEVNVVQVKSGTQENQQWKFVKEGDYYNVVNRQSGKALDVKDGSKNEGTPIIQWAIKNTSSLNQQWSLEKTGDSYTLKARHSSLMLSVVEGSLEPGAKFVQAKHQPGDSQHFELMPVKEGSMAKGIQPPKSLPDFLVMARARIEVKGRGFEIALRFPADPMSKELREIKLPSRDVRITGLDSKGIEINTLAKTLTKFTPIYVTIRPEPIDPFWLLNAKAGSLIFTVEPQKLFAPPTQPPVAPTDPDDSPKPSTPYGNLGTALAKVEAQGKQLTVTVRDVNFEMVDRQIEVMVFEESVKEINGKQVVTKTPRKEIRTVPFPVPKGFRDIKLSAKDVKVFDLKGKPFPQDQLATRFAEFSPITVTMDEATGNDAFWMATSKDGTLVFVVEPAKLRPTSGSNNPMGPQASDD